MTGIWNGRGRALFWCASQCKEEWRRETPARKPLFSLFYVLVINAKKCKTLQRSGSQINLVVFSYFFFLLFLLNVFVSTLEQHHIDEGTFSVYYYPNTVVQWRRKIIFATICADFFKWVLVRQYKIQNGDNMKFLIKIKFYVQVLISLQSSCGIRKNFYFMIGF